MALDWKQEISFKTVLDLAKSKKGPSSGNTEYPTKETMNLYQGDKKTTDIRKLVIVGVLFALFIALFVKFGVLDQMAKLSQKEAELAQEQRTASAMKTSTEEYNEIKELYDAYMVRYGENSTDAIAIMDMVEQHVMGQASVSAMVYSDNTLTLTLYNVPLDTVGNLAKDLEGQSMVSSVNVSTVTTQNIEGNNTVSTLVITLVGAESEAE